MTWTAPLGCRVDPQPAVAGDMSRHGEHLYEHARFPHALTAVID